MPMRLLYRIQDLFSEREARRESSNFTLPVRNAFLAAAANLTGADVADIDLAIASVTSTQYQKGSKIYFGVAKSSIYIFKKS
jgi:hypothetical protein